MRVHVLFCKFMNNRWIMRSKTPSVLLFTAKNVINATKKTCASGHQSQYLYRYLFARFVPMRGTIRFVLAEWREKHIFALAERGRAQALPLFAFLGQTILYEQEKLSYRIVKIIGKSVKICSLIVFPRCFIVNTSLFFAEIFKERILLSLIIPKLSRRPALTIANAA